MRYSAALLLLIASIVFTDSVPAQVVGRGSTSAGRANIVRTIDQAGAVSAALKSGPQCKAYAPAEWRTIGGSQAGDAFDLVSGDGKMYAGWGIRGVNRAMEGAYGSLYSDPETSSLVLAGAVLQQLGSTSEPRYSGAAQQLGAGFVAREFRSATHRGLLVYRVYPAPPGYAPGSYIISLRIAAAESGRWARDGQRIAVGVASSIDCTTMLQAPRSGDADLPRPGDTSGARGRGGETADLADYNVQLGTQWAHSESTGERYLLDHASSWNENGPDGPGYYRKSGNSYEKLVPGYGG